VAAAVTDGKITIKGANIPDIVDGLIKWFSMFNIDIQKTGADLIISVGKGGLEIDSKKEGFPLAAPNLPKLYPRPWPGFPVDAIPSIAPLASKSRGRLLLKNWMYESGLDFVRELNQMGADIMMMDPEKIIINGPVKFKGGSVTTPSVIQACKAIFLAALADPVTTTIYGVDILRRRYPNIFEVYRHLGAQIEIVDEKVGGVK
jgi:UDP-N-acetylglucosamine enolpyruvyl transferase